jgi:hypothetical protein
MRYSRHVSVLGWAFLAIALVRLVIYTIDHVPAGSSLHVVGG